jgi:hypothetical protein
MASMRVMWAIPAPVTNATGRFVESWATVTALAASG